ncbi:MAG: hypothetical protein ACI38A_06090 [Candidatus Ornithomonoglobus sp.]
MKIITKAKTFIAGMFEFSKLLTVAITVFYIYILKRILDLAEISVINQFGGTLPYLSAVASAVSVSFGAIIAAVMDKSKKENLNKYSGGDNLTAYTTGETESEGEG